MRPELSRLISLVEIEKKPLSKEIVATEEERSALSERLQIVRIDRLEATVRAAVEGPRYYHIQGELTAQIVQACIRTLEPIAQTVETSIDFRLTTDPSCAPQEGLEMEFGVEDDLEFVNSNQVDLGELVTQQLSISLDPYPRSDGSEIRSIEGVEVVWNSTAPKEPAAEAPATVRPFANLAELLNKDDD